MFAGQREALEAYKTPGAGRFPRLPRYLLPRKGIPKLALGLQVNFPLVASRELRMHTNAHTTTGVDGNALLEFLPERPRTGGAVDLAFSTAPKASAAAHGWTATRSGLDVRTGGRATAPSKPTSPVVLVGVLALFASVLGVLFTWQAARQMSTGDPAPQPVAMPIVASASPPQLDPEGAAGPETPTGQGVDSTNFSASDLPSVAGHSVDDHAQAQLPAGLAAGHPTESADVTLEPRRTEVDSRALGKSSGVPQAPSPDRGKGVTRSAAGVKPLFLGSIEVRSSPPGSRVLINGAFVGLTPLTLRDLPVGSRAIRVEAQGHEPWTRVVRVVAGQEARVNATLPDHATSASPRSEP